MLPPRFTFRNVDVWNANGIQKSRDLLVEGGRISKIEARGVIPADETENDLEGEGLALLPCGIDLQVHLRVPGQSEKELPMTGLRSALRCGYAAVVSMPNTKPVIDTPEVLARAQSDMAEAERATGVKAFFTGALTLGQLGLSVVDGPALAKAGAVALTDDGKGVASDDVMLAAFRQAAAASLPALQHAEVPGHGAALAPGPTQRKLGLIPYPAEAEWKMVERDLRLLEQVPGARYHVLHISSLKTVELIRAAKKKGLQVTGEVTPHHLWFSSEDIPVDNTNFKMNPPLRSPEDREALCQALADGTIDYASTDHAPHECGAKQVEFPKAAFGTTAQEATLRVLLAFWKQGRLSPSRLVEVWASGPAKFLKLEQEYGSLTVGQPFRAVWVDVNAPAQAIQTSELESLSKNSCFLGTALPGRIRGVFNEAGAFRF